MKHFPKATLCIVLLLVAKSASVGRDIASLPHLLFYCLLGYVTFLKLSFHCNLLLALVLCSLVLSYFLAPQLSLHWSAALPPTLPPALLPAVSRVPTVDNSGEPTVLPRRRPLLVSPPWLHYVSRRRQFSMFALRRRPCQPRSFQPWELLSQSPFFTQFSTSGTRPTM